jgi:hypothetical protein
MVFALAILPAGGTTMITKRQVDRVGGVGSIAVGFGCAWIGRQDWLMEHSLWKAWAVMCVVLVLNGFAMIRYSLRPERDGVEDGPGGGVVRGSSRV